MLDALIKHYLKVFPDEEADLKELLDQISAGETLDDRRNFRGHLTASGIILSPDKTKILLIHHKAYDRWQQPGGHVDKGEEAYIAAKREILEETQVKINTYIPFLRRLPGVPFDINSHPVPARPEKNEPPHRHHDFRYAFVAQSTRIFHQETEVISTKWFSVEDPILDNLGKALDKLKQRGIIA